MNLFLIIYFIIAMIVFIAIYTIQAIQRENFYKMFKDSYRKLNPIKVDYLKLIMSSLFFPITIIIIIIETIIEWRN